MTFSKKFHFAFSGSQPWAAPIQKQSLSISSDHLPLGYRSRQIFDRFIRHRQMEPSWQQAYWPGMPALIELGRLIYWWWISAPTIQREMGLSSWRQLRDAWYFTWHEKLQAQLYYMFELYRPEERARAAEYLTRRETKNGLIRALNCINRNGRGKQTDLGDKAAFTDRLIAHDLPHIPVLLTCEAGEITPKEIDPALFNRDLFIKDRYGKGAQGATLIPSLGVNRYRYKGVEISLSRLIAELREKSRVTPLIVMPRLENHPGLAQLAEKSLLVFRVFTCLDEGDNPVVAFAMLRILGKLEPSWQMHTEWGAEVHLPTGQLGLLVGDMPHIFNKRYTHHPVNGAPIEGLVVPFWTDLCGVAINGHRIAMDRVLIGWDIAITTTGPVILEANAIPDVLFPQRVLRQPIGEMTLGKFMHRYLDKLEQQLDLLPPDLRR